MMKWAHDEIGIKVIRYPKCEMKIDVATDDAFPQWKVLKEGKDGYILTHGAAMIEVAMSVSELLGKNGRSVGVVNARFLSPIDEIMLGALAGLPLYVLEDVIYSGSLAEHLAAKGYSVKAFTLPNTYVPFGKPFELRAQFGLDAESITKEILHEA